MATLEQDFAFLDRVTRLVREAELMREPRFDAGTSTLSEGLLVLDLLNVWHHSRQLTHPQTEEILERWLHPPSLETAAAFGRLDVVQAAIAGGAELYGRTAGDPIDLAVGAFCVTPLHLALVRRLIAAGVPVHRAHLSTWSREAIGSKLDFELNELLHEHLDEP